MKRSLIARRKHDAAPKIEVKDDGTPECLACGEKNIGLGSDALLMLRGQWMPYREHDVAAFVVSADTQLHIEQLPNGQLLIIPDVQGHPTKHAHLACIRDLVNDLMGIEMGGDEDEDDEGEEYE